MVLIKHEENGSIECLYDSSNILGSKYIVNQKKLALINIFSFFSPFLNNFMGDTKFLPAVMMIHYIAQILFHSLDGLSKHHFSQPFYFS